MIPISAVRLGSDVENRVLQVLRSGVIAQGPVVAEFEQRFATLVGAKHAIAVNNGTTALVAAIQALNLAPGDEVITSPFTFIATLNAILEAGATVRFGDILEEDFALDPISVRSLVNEKTKAIIPVHLYGQSADMGAIGQIANEFSLAIVEDAAQAHGATFQGRGVGTFGLGCFSFYATKNLSTGEGGMITTNDDSMADKLRVMRNQGMRARYEYVMAGHNYRLTDLQAALVIPQLDTYDELLTARRANAQALSELLGDLEGIVLPRQVEGREHVWHQYTILLPEATDRQEFVDALAAEGVGSGIYYPKLVFDYATYADRPDVIRSKSPVAESIAARCVSLPVHQFLTGDDIRTIASVVRKVLSR